MDLGLARIQSLLNALGNPQDQLRIIHVAGTNGKGSVCAYTASVLLQLGLTVGRFNSPHLLQPHDSININSAPVSEDEYKRTCAHVEKVNNNNQLTASSFEQLVATALVIFHRHKLDWIVIEVGLGGALDATNVFKQPKMTIVTAIGWDHAGILGGTIESIAEAKAGIIKQGCPAVFAPQEDASVLDILAKYADSVGAPWKLVKEAEWEADGVCCLNLDEQVYRYTVPLCGDYQRANSAAAVTALVWLRETGVIQFTEAQLQEGMAATRWPGRLEYISAPVVNGVHLPSILVDGAHNPPATRALRQHIDYLQPKSVTWIIGVTTGKDVDEMLRILLRPQDTVVAVPFSQPEGMPWIQCVSTTEIEGCARKIVPNAFAFGSLLPALESLSKASSSSLTVLCGSLYLVADFFRLLNVQP